MNEKKLIRNAIQCNHCGDIIESKYTHDFKFCKCKSVAVDGGLSYARRVFTNSSNDFTDLSEWEEIKGTKEVDYTIVSKPSYITFECPYCKEKVEIPFEEVDFNTDYWGDGAVVYCPECCNEVTLGDWEYD